ncbi:hypothetical protein AB0K18_22410 [Nonomuraea sp. NPDC049421]|uniref:hypothetical protein n=1 Tax=Nonomuraea sp. NPDC049421 TaxID=3155275 RepID=UPI003444EB7E
MNTVAKLGSYALGLAVVFGGALGAGKLTTPDPTSAAARTADAQESAGQSRTTGESAGHGHASDKTTGPEQSNQEQPAQEQDHTDDHTTPQQQTATDTPGGLQVSQDGYTLNLIDSVSTKSAEDFEFTVIGPDGSPVKDYEVEHDKKLHFIVASRDLTSFQHLHPELSPDGTWSVRLKAPKPGPYRAFADFVPTGGEKLTLGADLMAGGDYRPDPLPEVSRTAKVDGYTVNLDGDLAPGKTTKLTLTVSKDGKPVDDLEPYLGAYGHLVALRAHDLAYLHVHPEESDTAGPGITFYAEAPSRGDYRLFLDFKHKGEVRTASFTAQADPDAHADDHTH